MGKCIYCARSAGLFGSKHESCERTVKEASALVATAASGREDGLKEKLEPLARSAPTPEVYKEGLVRGWESALDAALEDGVLTQEEEHRLMQLAADLTLAQPELDRRRAWTRASEAAALRDLGEGKIPTRQAIEGNLPFNLQRSEQLVWVFPQTEYFEQRVQHSYSGVSQGLSIRLVKGVYYRPSAFRVNPVERSHLVQVDTGYLGATTKHIYFGGPAKSLRVPYGKVVSFVPFSDGFGIHRDAASAKPQMFLTGDGWFAYNLFVNLAQRAS